MEQDDQSQMSNLPDLDVFRERLEQQEANKLKAEQIVSTLSRFKAREKASRRRLSTHDESSMISSGDRKSNSSPNSAVKEKSNFLKRKLEEDRAKVESQRGSDSLDKVNEVVETIKAQLEDRGKLMQQLLLSAQQQQQIERDLIKGSDGDSKSAIEPLSEPELPDEIKQKIADLEAKVIDLQENLKEKDEVISARTQAIALLSEDMSRKSKTTLDTLEETQEQMRQMQNNFISIEDRMKKEHQRLKEEAEDKKQRCLQAEKSLRIVEAARFDLSTRVAELQEKVVALQMKNIDLEKNVSEAETKQNELKDALEAAKNMTIKMKAQFKIKMKALEEECTLRKTTGDGNAVSSLKERIAELEEEKEQCRLLKERVTELEQKLTQQGDDLDSHVKAMSKLELEKLDLIQVVQERNSLLSDKESLIYQLQQQLAEVEQLKVSAEMRSIELEEKLDAAIRDTRNVGSEDEINVANLKQQINLQEETIKELQLKLSTRQNEISQGGGDGAVMTELNSELEEWKQKYLDMESRYNKVNDLYNSFENRVDEAEKQNEQIVIECNNLRTTVSQLQTVLNQNSPEESFKYTPIESASKSEDSATMSFGSDEKDVEINRLREELQATVMELHRLSTALDNMNITSQQIDELNKQIVEKDKALTDVSSELDKRTRKLSDYKKFHKLKSEDVIRVSHELESVTASSQEKIAEMEKEIESARDKESELLRQIKELKDTQSSSSTNQVPPSDQTQKMKKLVANLKLKTKTCKDLEMKLEECKKCLEEKENLVQEFITKETSNLLEISELKSQLNELQLLADKKLPEQEKTPDLAIKLEALLLEKDNLNSKILDQQQLICQLENEMKMIKQERESAFSQLEIIQENEFSKNDELFKMLEVQVAESKDEIQYLQGQLTDFVSKYEQTWAKLQEKEAYIESVEAELSKAQEKMRSIESNTGEMVQGLKGKIELFGNRLKQAEEANVEFEKYRSDVEHKLAVSGENEMFLRNNLADKTNENEELKRIVSDLSNRNEWMEKETNNLKNHISNLQNEIANLHLVQDAYNRSLEETEKLNNEIKQLKLMNERTIVELNEKEKIAVESLENELKSLSDKCSAVENERNYLSKEFESVLVANQVLKDEMEKLKSDFESRYSFLESERNHYEELYSKLKIEISVKEENIGAISENKSKEIEGIMNEQRLFVERLHAEFKQSEDNYFSKIQEQDEYIRKLKESLQTIESNTESLKYKLQNVGLELMSSKEELIALRHDQERTVNLKNELEKVKDDYCHQLEEEREHVKMLEVELLREKTKKEIDNVVREAEVKVDSMCQAQQVESSPPLFKFSESNQDDIAKSFDIISQQPNVVNQDLCPSKNSESVNVDELKHQLNIALNENEKLSAIITAFESNRQNIVTEVIPNVEPNLCSSSSSRIDNKDEEDGWGWGGEEVAMEQETATVVGTIPGQRHNPSQQVDTKISLLEQKLQQAEAENARLAEELKGSQVRCSKLVKKAKELKAKSEDLERGSREKSVGFEDLDFAMQEELRGQIEKLEKNLQEALNENKSWKTEKENYLRKIDTLISGNERLVDMKERQDIELSMFQKQNSDLKQQILGHEWKIEELMEDHEKLSVNCKEMEEKINNLASENEHLIKIVGDMKDQQKGLTVQTQPQENMQESNQNPMFTMFRDDSSNEQQKMKDSKYDSLFQNYELLLNEKNGIVAVNNELKIKVDSFNVRINELEIENFDLKNKLENHQASSDSETNQISQLLEENERLQESINVNKTQLNEYKSKLEELQRANKSLEESFTSLQNLTSGVEDQNRIMKEEFENKYENLLKEFNVVSDELQVVKQEKENSNKTLQEVEREKPKEEVIQELTGAAVMFRGFADDSSAADPFVVPEEKVEKQQVDLPKYKKWDAIALSQNITSNNVSELKDQVLALTTLLQEKEMELEVAKQSLDNLKLKTENLRDVWSDKFEDLKIEQSSVNTDNLGMYEDILNAAEQKFKDVFLLKDEEIAHLTCELSSREQQLINLKKEVTNLTNVKTELSATMEKYNIENDSLQTALNELREEYFKLQQQLNELSEIERDRATKLNDAELKLRDLQIEYDNCLKAIADESEIKTTLEQNYNMCCHYLEEKERIILEKEKLLEEANVKLEKLNDALSLKRNTAISADIVTTATEVEESQKQQTLVAAISTPPTSLPPGSNNDDPNRVIYIDEQITKYKEMIKQRDIEIERLMQALGEAEERLIKAEEMRLSSEDVNGLRLRLDEALYTLHLRDIRCEELTLELMQLLEERDTLQLRLSTAIRLNEELRHKGASSNVASEQIVIATNNSSSCTTRTSSIEHNQSSSDQETTQSDSESGRLDRLNEKLGELHNTGYQRDLSLHQDRLKRHNEQMHLYSSSNSPQQASPAQTSMNIEDCNTSGGFLSWIFGGGSGALKQQIRGCTRVQRSNKCRNIYGRGKINVRIV